VFAQVRAEASNPAPTSHPHRAWRGRWLAAAAVVGLAVGGGAVAASTQLGGRPSARTVQLAAFGAGTVPATAKVIGGDEVTLDAASLPSPGAGKLYEVWLTNSARTRMYAVGSLGANRTGTFTVAADLIGTYNSIEVSVQPLNDSAYSGVSVLRGAYT
jgi:anti-sigma-K factor RskA